MKASKTKGKILKSSQIHIRVTDDQKTALTEAATRAGLGVSSWLLMLGLRETQRDPGGMA
jgi:uncharacterized protein (DUF1778 family)